MLRNIVSIIKNTTIGLESIEKKIDIKTLSISESTIMFTFLINLYSEIM